MSYCRFGWDNSSVYIFESVNGSLECCGCRLDDFRSGQWNWKDVASFLVHLDLHEAVGDTVPVTVRSEIIEDWQQGRFADWDETDPEDMGRFLALPKVTDQRDYITFLSENRQMLGWDDDQFNHFKQIMEEKSEARSETADRPAAE